MAIRPAELYPDQAENGDPGFPLGKARNRSVPGDPTGWPLERTWVNDWLGFGQALLGAAEVEASGSPDQVGASQYLEAIQVVSAQAAAPVAAAAVAPAFAQLGITQTFCFARLVQGAKNDGQAFGLGLLLSSGGTFSVPAGDRVQVPVAGTYEVELSASFTASTAGWRARLDLVRGSNIVVATIDVGPFEADAVANVSMIAFVAISDPGSQQLQVMSRQNGLTALGSLSPQRSMMRVRRLL